MKMDEGNPNNHQALKIRLLALTLLIGCGLIVYWLNPEPLREFIHLLLARDISTSIEHIRLFGNYAALVTFIMIVFINITAILPNIFVLAAAGIIFGEIEGTLIAWAAESVGVTISFILMRYFFLDHTRQIIMRSNALKRVNDFGSENGFKVMLIARSIPFVPSGLITALGAASSITLSDYILATFIGKLPSAWIEVTLGHDLASYHEHMVRLTLLVIISASAYGIYRWINNNSRT